MGAVIGRTSVATPHASPALNAVPAERKSSTLTVRTKERSSNGTRNASEVTATPEMNTPLGYSAQHRPERMAGTAAEMRRAKQYRRGAEKLLTTISINRAAAGYGPNSKMPRARNNDAPGTRLADRRTTPSSHSLE